MDTAHGQGGVGRLFSRLRASFCILIRNSLTLFNTDFFFVMFVTIDSKKEIGYKTTKEGSY